MLEEFMSIKKIIRKAIPYSIRVFLIPLKKLLFDNEFKARRVYTKTCKNVPIHQQMIFYESYHGQSMTGNPYAVFRYLITHPSFQKYKHVWAIRDPIAIPEQYKDLSNVSFVSYRSKEYAKTLAIAKYLINDTTFPAYFLKRKGQTYANIWHGTPLKTMGLDIKKRGYTDHKNIQRNFLFTDYFVSPNRYTAEKLLKSHDVYNIFNGYVLDTGYPRIDLMFQADRMKIRNEFQLPLNKKVILYAPTWRNRLDDEEKQQQQLVEDVKTIQKRFSREYVILLKTHYYETIKEEEIKCVPNSMDTNELLAIVDLLITDYSSIFFDFLPTKKPIIFFTRDLREYEQYRGTYLNMKELPGPLCETLEDVIYSIQHIEQVKLHFDNQYQSFIKRFCYHDDGNACLRFVETVLQGKPSNFLFKTNTDKIKILLYGGGFLNNGITASIISLLNAIDYEKYDVTLIDHGNNHSREKWNNIKKINQNIHHIFRVGTWNATLVELYRHALFLQTGSRKIAPKHMYKREFKRMVGLTTFDIGIDFSGYSPFWATIFAYGDLHRKSIYLHSDMEKEMHKKVNDTYPHRRNLKVVFSLYNLFDKVLSVSELTFKQNMRYLQDRVETQKMDYVVNTIDYNRVLSLKNQGEMLYEFGKETDSKSLLKPMVSYPLPNSADINFITIGRLGPEKDHSKLIRSFSKLTDEHSRIKLYIVGEGALKTTLLQLVKSLGLEGSVFFTGQLNNPYALLHNCDCFILPSNHEGQPIVLLEALILRKPIIVTDIPGSRSVIEGGYGLIVENSVAGLVSGMRRFLNGERLNEHVFDYKAYRNHALDMFYEKVCNQNKA